MVKSIWYWPNKQIQIVKNVSDYEKMNLIIGIDASRNRSGGAKAHLIGILSSVDPARHGISEIHVWSFKSLLDSIPNQPWLFKHNPPVLEQSLPAQLWWQAIQLTKELKRTRCDILYASFASTLCHYRPMVALSQDMLSYEPGVMRHFGWGYARLRLLAILYLQNTAFRRAQGVIFLTRYAGKMIQKSCGSLPRVSFIPHGVDEAFSRTIPLHEFPDGAARSLHCLYISPISRYKHQWNVVQAIELLRERGVKITLDLVGGGDDFAKNKLTQQLNRSDPNNLYVRQAGLVPHSALHDFLAKADLFVFASSCENMPVTLLEAMAVGLPIASSASGPLPEVLEDAGVYFDPEKPDSIAKAIEQIITDAELRTRITRRSKELAGQYSWKRCAYETFAFIANTLTLYKN